MHKNVSFHNGNLNPEIEEFQKKVFDKLGLTLIQVETNLSHGEAIDFWLRNNKWDTVTIYDIDCIPLCANAAKLAEQFANDQIVYGAAQQANHIENSGVYVSPAFISFSRKLYDKMGRPSFKATKYGDVGYKMTTSESVMIWPIQVEVPKWDLGVNSTFGLGTTYQTGVYHAFESRMGNGEMFIKKCKEVLDGRAFVE